MQPSVSFSWKKRDKLKSLLDLSDPFQVEGKVTRVKGLIIEGYLPKAAIGATCKIMRENNATPLFAEVIGLNAKRVIMMPIGATEGVCAGDRVQAHQALSHVRVGPNLLGKVVNGLGEIISSDERLNDFVYYPIYQQSPKPLERGLISDILSLGVKALDGLLTTGVGQRQAIIAGSGVGKSTLLGMIAKKTKADVNVIALIGERGREVREFIEHNLSLKARQNSVVVVATSDEPALLRRRAAFCATAIAEYFRDQGKNVLLMMDSLTRYAMAAREIGLSLGEPPTVKGYPPSLFSELPQLLERAGNVETSGSITGLYTVLAEGDDTNDPLVDATRAIVDGHIVLSRKIASLGQYPAIDVNESLSRVMPQIVKSDHLQSALKLRSLLSTYDEMQDYINIGMYNAGQNERLDEAVNKRESILEFLKQNDADKYDYHQAISLMHQIAKN